MKITTRSNTAMKPNFNCCIITNLEICAKKSEPFDIISYILWDSHTRSKPLDLLWNAKYNYVVNF